MYVCVDGCMLHCAILSRACTDVGCYVISRTCTDLCCYALGSPLILAQTADVTLQDLLLCTQDSWCNVKRSYKIPSLTSIDAWCYVTRSPLVLAQTLDVTLQDLLLYMRRHLMVSPRICFWTCTDTSCYINLIFSCSCKDTWGEL